MERITDVIFSTNRREAYRYMGYRGLAVPNEEIQQHIEECISQLEAVTSGAGTPRGVYRIDPLVFRGNSGEDFILAGFPVHSKQLGKNLRGCTHTILLAGTLGIQVDRLIERYARTGIARAAMMQACAASMIESWLDAFEEQLAARFANEEIPLYLRPRYSPGFGDFGISYQPSVLQALDANKLLGITLTEDSNLMLPLKTVTAVIGLSPEPRIKRSSCAGETTSNSTDR